MTADRETQFKNAVSIVQNLPKDGETKPTQNDQLAFYALFKQATVGEVNIPRPGTFDFAGKVKWDAWKSHEGLSQDEAKERYVKLLREYLENSSDKEQSAKLLEQLDATS